MTTYFGVYDILFDKRQLERGQMVSINNTYVNLEIPKFVHGDGSYIELQLVASNDSQISKYNINVRSIYDQGSSLWSPEKRWPKWIEDLSEFSFIFLIIWPITYYIVIRYLFTIISWYIRKRYFKALLEQLLSIRNIFKSNSYSKIIFENLWEDNIHYKHIGKTKDFKNFWIYKITSAWIIFILLYNVAKK